MQQPGEEKLLISKQKAVSLKPSKYFLYENFLHRK